MTHLANKNPFKNQGLAIFGAGVASFGKRFGKKKSFKVKEMPFMTQIANQKWRDRGFDGQKKKKQVKRECK